jgi:hypothetical protein
MRSQTQAIDLNLRRNDHTMHHPWSNELVCQLLGKRDRNSVEQNTHRAVIHAFWREKTNDNEFYAAIDILLANAVNGSQCTCGKHQI